MLCHRFAGSGPGAAVPQPAVQEKLDARAGASIWPGARAKAC
jgi:hypothetical protein